MGLGVRPSAQPRASKGLAVIDPAFLLPSLPLYHSPHSRPSQSQLPLGRGLGPHSLPGQPLEYHLPQPTLEGQRLPVAQEIYANGLGR